MFHQIRTPNTSTTTTQFYHGNTVFQRFCEEKPDREGAIAEID